MVSEGKAKSRQRGMVDRWTDVMGKGVMAFEGSAHASSHSLTHTHTHTGHKEDGKMAEGVA